MALKDLTAAAVRAAIAEYDQLGRDAFLARYGFKKARGYYLLHDGKRYDSKAIVGAAHGYIGPGWEPLAWGDFSGGAATVKPTLEALGFVLALDQNPDWSRDELLLALELYLTSKGQNLNQTSKPVLELSALLNRLAVRMGHVGSETFRNENGVHMKLMNFRRCDPNGGGGLERGNSDEERVWALYAHDLPKLVAVTDAIRAAIGSAELLTPLTDEDDDYEAEEGGLLTRLHKTYERDRTLVARRKAKARRAGPLRCEACDFDFAACYGAHGDGYIEAHHVRAVHTLGSKATTKASELALVCANCHRMIHRRRPWLSIEELRALVKSTPAS